MEDSVPWAGRWGVFEVGRDVHSAPTRGGRVAAGHLLHESCPCGPIADDEGARRVLKHLDVDLTA